MMYRLSVQFEDGVHKVVGVGNQVGDKWMEARLTARCSALAGTAGERRRSEGARAAPPMLLSPPPVALSMQTRVCMPRMTVSKRVDGGRRSYVGRGLGRHSEQAGR